MKFERFGKLLPALALAAGVAYAPQAEAKFVFAHNHPDLDWYTIETEHFAVHYPMSRDPDNAYYLESEQSARLTARVAEEMWPRMCANYNYYLKERVHIVILNQTDHLEGFTVPPWDWIEVSVNPGSFFYRSRGRMEWLSDVLYHEFSHVVSLKANATMSEGTGGVIVGGLYQDGINDVDTGVEFFIMDADPPSFSEGVAEGASEMIGGNWWTTSRDHNLRMTWLEDDGELIMDFDRWQTFAQGRVSWNDFERIYQQGYAFNNYLRQRFGEHILDQAAVEAGKKWRPIWYNVLEDMTGVPAETLFDDFVDYMYERYNAQYDAIKAEGEVVGRQLLPGPAEWEYTSPSAREAWREKKTTDKVKAKQGPVYVIAPRYDAELGISGVNQRGQIALKQWDIDTAEAFTGAWPGDAVAADNTSRHSVNIPAEFMYSWDFVEGEGKVVVTGHHDMIAGPLTRITGMDPDLRGYHFTELYVADLVEREEKDNGQEYLTWQPKKSMGKSVWAKDQIRAIPNTLRGVEPNVHPDGDKIVFAQYADGTQNLAVVNLDGTGKEMLTDFNDGSWMQTPKWSPDGKYIAVGIFRNYRQNLYLYDVEAKTFEALTWDAWEEMDVEWTPDGKGLYFTADPEGVYNVYHMDIETRDVTQITNVVGAAYCPTLTPDGNLVYNYYTAHGYKVYGLHKADFMNKPATHLFQTQPDEAEVAANWAYSEDLTHWEAKTHPYRWSKALMPPTVYPMIRLENDSRTNIGLQGGFQMFLQDYVEKHGAFLYFLIGEDVLFMGQYFNQMWYPNIYLMAYHYEVKYDAGYWVDWDDDDTTTDDQGIYEIKNQQYANIGLAWFELPWSDRWYTSLTGMFLEYGFKSTSENQFLPYQYGYEVGLDVGFSNISYYYSRNPNPPPGRNIEFQAIHAFTDVVYKPYGGVMPDDGQLLDKYHYNKFELRWTEQMSVPTFGLGFMEVAREKGHRIQFDTRFGWVDRNVNYNDEFRAGGQHPYYWGNNSLRPNTQFSGYPPGSLLGETMAIANLAYRFPIKGHLKKKIGPIWLDSIYGQVMGGAGNLWSFQPPDDPDKYWRNEWDERIANNPDEIEREIPFVDESYKTGGHRMLYDAGAEIRVAGAMFNSAYWNSFVRVAYGFQEIRGIGDVDGDDIYDTSENAIGDELSNETHPAGFRVYIGLGTGW